MESNKEWQNIPVGSITTRRKIDQESHVSSEWHNIHMKEWEHIHGQIGYRKSGNEEKWT